MIPFFDLQRQYQSISAELEEAAKTVFHSGQFISGEQVKKFETTFARYLGIKECISCASGTDALELILRAWKIGKHDEVIVPALTWISDAEAVHSVGATPVFVDINEENYCIDTKKIGEKITTNTKVIIAVHLFGHPAEMAELVQLAQRNNLLLLEDCAHSHGAEYKGQKTGTFGDAAIFSFYPTKNLGAYGDAGAVVTNNEEVAKQVRLYSDHGQQSKNVHLLSGGTSRMDELQAAYLNVKLRYLDSWNEKRQQIGGKYFNKLRNVMLPRIDDNVNHIFHQFVLRSERRNHLREYLLEKGIGSAIHYPYPLPATKPFFEREWKSTYPVSAAVSGEIFSIPVFPELKGSEIDYIIESINSYM